MNPLAKYIGHPVSMHISPAGVHIFGTDDRIPVVIWFDSIWSRRELLYIKDKNKTCHCFARRNGSYFYQGLLNQGVFNAPNA